MIDFEKEREAFEAWQDSIGSNIAKRGLEYVNDRTASEWFSWRNRAALSQAEINELKQKLAEEQAKQTMWCDEKNHAIKRWSDIAKDCEALKQKLEKLESGEFVLVPRDKIEILWQDDDEPENFVNKESDFDCLGDCIDLNEIMTINAHHQANLKTEKMYGTWFAEVGHPKEKANFHVGTHQECLDIITKNKAMIEAVEKDHE